MIPEAIKRLGIETKLVADPIIVHLTQSIVKPSFNVALGVELFCGGI